jgi:hypothetical protein
VQPSMITDLSFLKKFFLKSEKEGERTRGIRHASLSAGARPAGNVLEITNLCFHFGFRVTCVQRRFLRIRFFVYASRG